MVLRLVEDRTHEGGKIRMLNIIDEFTHECLAIRVSRRLKSIDVIDALADLFMLRGVPRHIRSDNGPEFMAKAVQDWIAAVGASTAYIARGSPWENGFIESFNARLRDELLDGEIFYSLREAQIVIGAGDATTMPSAACLHRLSGSRPGGVRARTRRMAGCATPASSAGRAPTGATTSPRLTSQPDHPTGPINDAPRPSCASSRARSCIFSISFSSVMRLSSSGVIMPSAKAVLLSFPANRKIYQGIRPHETFGEAAPVRAWAALQVPVIDRGREAREPARRHRVARPPAQPLLTPRSRPIRLSLNLALRRVMGECQTTLRGM